MALYIAESFPLKKGMKGEKIKNLQKALGLTADGIFGDRTEVACQTKFGTKTCSMMQYDSVVKKSNTNTNTNTNTNNMATPTSYSAESFPLAKGMQGENIKTLQKNLGVEQDGKFWTATETALKNLYNVTTCSEELFKQITGSESTIAKKTSPKRFIKLAAITGLVLAGGALVYNIFKGKESTTLDGVRKRKKSRKVSYKEIALK